MSTSASRPPEFQQVQCSTRRQLFSDRRVQQCLLIVATALCSCTALAAGYWLGSGRQDVNQENDVSPVAALLASTAASSDNMAVATGTISEDTEGIFFLDYITGDLQCVVYYPRYKRFGAHYYANVVSSLAGAPGKNAKYLLVTGQAIQPSNTGNTRPAHSLVYVTDVNNGTFAAFAVPWNRTAETTGTPQSGPLIFVDGGRIRNFQLRDPAQNQPAAIVDPNKKP